MFNPLITEDYLIERLSVLRFTYTTYHLSFSVLFVRCGAICLISHHFTRCWTFVIMWFFKNIVIFIIISVNFSTYSENHPTSWRIKYSRQKCITVWISYQFMSTLTCKPSEVYCLEYKDLKIIIFKCCLKYMLIKLF